MDENKIYEVAKNQLATYIKCGEQIEAEKLIDNIAKAIVAAIKEYEKQK